MKNASIQTGIAARVGGVTLASRVIGLVRVVTIAAVLGTTHLGDAFQSANAMSNVLFELLAAGALSAVLVPAFVRIRESDGDGAADHLAGSLLTLAMIILGTITLAAMVGAPLIARLLTSGVPMSVRGAQRELVTFLLFWFLPQTLLYVWGAIATGLLHARRRFLAVAAAPIGNTIVTIGALIGFRASVGDATGLDLSADERMWLVLAGTGGVVAFVATIVIAAQRSGARLRLRRDWRSPQLRALLADAAWGVVLHAAGGAFLLAAMVVGNSVAGGAVAYQTAFVFFLAPYAVLCQPIQTVVQPELASDMASQRHAEAALRIRAALIRTVVLALGASLIGAALAAPAMAIVPLERVDDALLAAALVTLLVGLCGYSVFLLLARASYALGDARTPSLVVLVATALGIASLVLVAPQVHGTARVAAVGLAHSLTYVIAALAMFVHLRRSLQDAPPRQTNSTVAA